MFDIQRLKYLDYESIDVRQKEFQYSDRPNVEYKYRKLFFFLFREGIIKTFRKIQSKKQKSLEILYYYTVIKIKKNGHYYYNFSTQTSSNIDEFVIENVFYKSNSFDLVTSLSTLEKKIFNQYNNNNSFIYKIFIHLEEKYPVTKSEDIDKGIYIYGLGDYSRVYIAPYLKRQNNIFCVDYKIQLAKHYKEKYQFKKFGLVPQETYSSIRCAKKPLAIIAAYHSDHTKIATELYNNNTNTKIFIEKPPTVTLSDIENLIDLYNMGANIDIGYNRRYIPINKKIKEKTKNKQVMISISVKEILINKNHWYFWENQGTRITGNLTHWLDLATFWIDEVPQQINLSSSTINGETIALSVLYNKGSLLSIIVSDKGNSLRGVQEKIEIRTIDETFVIDDYIKYSHTGKNGRLKTKTYIKRIKGHENMYKHVSNWHDEKEEPLYSARDLVHTSLLTFYTSKMFKEKIHILDIENEINRYIDKL